MFGKDILPKQKLGSKFRKAIAAVLLIVGFFSYGYAGAADSNDALEVCSPKTVPLLLNSGEVQVEEAEISVIIWFEGGNIPPEVWTNKPTPNWVWTYKELSGGSNNKAATLAGQCRLAKNEEDIFAEWYAAAAREAASYGGIIYLDERVDEALDIAAFLSKANAEPVQAARIGNLFSLAAYQNNIGPSVLAGRERINIQLLSRGDNTVGQTVLAIPALLKEF